MIRCNICQSLYSGDHDCAAAVADRLAALEAENAALRQRAEAAEAELRAECERLRCEAGALREALELSQRFVMSFSTRPEMRRLTGTSSDPDRPRREACEALVKIRSALASSAGAAVARQLAAARKLRRLFATRPAHTLKPEIHKTAVNEETDELEHWTVSAGHKTDCHGCAWERERDVVLAEFDAAFKDPLSGQ